MIKKKLMIKGRKNSLQNMWFSIVANCFCSFPFSIKRIVSISRIQFSLYEEMCNTVYVYACMVLCMQVEHRLNVNVNLYRFLFTHWCVVGMVGMGKHRHIGSGYRHTDIHISRYTTSWDACFCQFIHSYLYTSA